VPFGRWVRGPYRDFAREMLGSEASRLARICSQAKLHSLLSEHVEGRQNHERVLWSLINLEIFLRVFKPSQVEVADAEAALKRAG
jgi:asparagine synthase (glutamine-hydrolysing)